MAFDPTTAVEFDPSTAIPVEAQGFDPTTAVEFDPSTATAVEESTPTGRSSFREDIVEKFPIDYPGTPFPVTLDEVEKKYNLKGEMLAKAREIRKRNPDISPEQYEKLLRRQPIKEQTEADLPPFITPEYQLQTAEPSTTRVETRPVPYKEEPPELKAEFPIQGAEPSTTRVGIGPLAKPQAEIVPATTPYEEVVKKEIEGGVFDPSTAEIIKAELTPDILASPQTEAMREAGERKHPIVSMGAKIASETPKMILAGELSAALLPLKLVKAAPTFSRVLGAAGAGAMYRGAEEIGKGEPITLEMGQKMLEEAGIWSGMELALIKVGGPVLKEIFGKVRRREELTPRESEMLESSAKRMEEEQLAAIERGEIGETKTFPRPAKEMRKWTVHKEFAATGQEPTKENFRVFWKAKTGEDVSREDAGRMLKEYNLFQQPPVKPVVELPEEQLVRETALKDIEVMMTRYNESMQKEIAENVPKTTEQRVAPRMSLEDLYDAAYQDAVGRGVKITPEWEAGVKEGIDAGAHNILTGLPGKAHRESFLNKIRIAPEGKVNMVVQGDLDYFKRINDTYGETAGDNFLRDVLGTVHKISKNVGFQELEHFHVSGDEHMFGAQIAEKDIRNTILKMGRIKRELDDIEVMLPDGKWVPVGQTMGLAFDKDVSLAFKRADAALKLQKKTAKNTLGIDIETQKRYTIKEGKPGADIGKEWEKAGLLPTSREKLEEAELGAVTKAGIPPDVQVPGRGGGGRKRIEGGAVEGTPGVETVVPEGRGGPPEGGSGTPEVKPVTPETPTGTVGEGVKSPDEHVATTPDAPEFVRQKGFKNQSGSIGLSKQRDIVPSTEGSRKAQNLARAQREKLKDVYNKPTDTFINRFLEKWVDVGAPWKRRLAKNLSGARVIAYHDKSRGASSEALHQFNVAEKEISGILPHDSEFLFNNMIQFRRMIELEKLKGMGYKKSHGLTAKELEEYLVDVKTQHPDTYKQLEKAADLYYKKISQEQLDQLVSEGLMTKEVRDHLLKTHAHYSPFTFIQHIDPTISTVNVKGAKVSVPDSGVKALAEGSEQELVNNWRLNLGQIIERTQGRIFKNRANRELRDYVVKNPVNDLGVEIEKPKSFVKEGPNKGAPVWDELPIGRERIYVMQNGKQYAMTMPTRIARTWVTSNPQADREFLRGIQWASGAAIVKPLATGVNPEFALANIPRDLAHIWFVTKEYSPVVPIAWAQMAKDMAEVAGDVVKRKGLYEEYVKRGGGMDFLTTQGQLKGTKPWEAVTPTDEIIDQMSSVLKWSGETSELWTRLALMNRALKNGKSMDEATWIARSYMDFALGGTWAKTIDNGVPYFNAAIQGTRGIFRAIKEDPALATFKAAQVVTAGAGLAYWNRTVNKDCWEHISDYQKVRNWIVTTPFTYKDENGDTRYVYMSIPKEQSQRVFSAIGEELTEKNMTGRANFEKIKMGANDAIPISPVDIGTRLPPTMSAILSYPTNKDFWRNQDIWKGRKGISPKEEYWNTTPQPWVLWGKATGMSPVRTQAAVQKIVPSNFYTAIMGVPWQQTFGSLEEKDKDKISKPFIARLTSLPGSKRFVRMTGAGTGSYEEMLERANKLMVPDVDGSGNPLSLSALKQDVEKAERNQADMRIQNDRKFKLIMSRFGVFKPEGQAKITEALKEIPDEEEEKRVEQMIGRKEKEEEEREYHRRNNK